MYIRQMVKFNLHVISCFLPDEEIVINPRDFPHINIGDIVEINNPDLEYR